MDSIAQKKRAKRLKRLRKTKRHKRLKKQKIARKMEPDGVLVRLRLIR